MVADGISSNDTGKSNQIAVPSRRGLQQAQQVVGRVGVVQGGQPLRLACADRAWV